MKFAESATHDVGALGRNAGAANAVGDIFHNAPALTLVSGVILAVDCGYKLKATALDVGDTIGSEFGTNMVGYSHDVAHEHIRVGEDVGIDVLKHIYRTIIGGYYLIGGVDETIAKRAHFFSLAFDGKIADY